MRCFAKLSVLLAPLVLASVSGCASPSWMMGKSSTKSAEQSRLERLMSVAEQYEHDGKVDAALRVYQHVLAQDPKNSTARERRDLLTQQLARNESSADKKTQAESAAEKTRIASHDQKQPAAHDFKQTETRSETLASSPVKAPESARAAAAEDIVQPANHTQTAEELPSIRPAVASKSGTDSNRKPLGADHRVPSSSAASSEPAAESEGQASPATQGQISQLDAAAFPDEESELDEAWEIAPSTPGIAHSGATEAADPWTRTDLRHHGVPQPAPAPLEDFWTGTRLVTLCSDLPADLVPLVTQLSDENPAQRIEALNQLAVLRGNAQPASMAVFALLEDPHPLVSINAASTLHAISGDVWGSVRTLSAKLDSQDEKVVRLSSYLLGQMGVEAMDAVSALEKVRDHRQGLSRLYAAEALNRIAPGDPSGVEILASALSDPDREIRWFAAVSLGTVEGEAQQAAADALALALHDCEPQVRAAACLSLGGLGTHAANSIPELERTAGKDVPEVQTAAETALACLKNEG